MPHSINLEQAERALVLGFIADIPMALWGPPGVGKSSIVRQLADKTGYKLYDYRLSDKEPSDLGGIPYPVDGKVTYLVPDGLPFDSEEKAIALLDEFDRADLSVQNVALQIILDRKVNGHSLSPRARVVLAGNGTTDQGTSALSKAAANRICHLYIEVGTPAALDSYQAWAEANDVSPLLRGFAQFRQEVWANGAANVQFEEMAYPSPRSFDYADRLLKAADAANFKTKDILPAVIAGCIGQAAATEFLAYRQVFNEAPSIEEIVADPDNARVPEDNPGVMYALTIALTDHAVRDKDATEAVARYGLRWPEEPAAFFFRRLLDKSQYTPLAPSYQKWNNTHLSDTTLAKGGTEVVVRDGVRDVLKALEGSKLLPDSDAWVNRIQFMGESGSTYIISQRRSNSEWACSCPTWRTRRECKHLNSVATALSAVKNS